MRSFGRIFYFNLAYVRIFVYLCGRFSLFLLTHEKEQARTQTQVKKTKFAIQSLSSRQGVFCRALYDVKRTRSTFRDGDSLLSCKGNLCNYVDNGSSWWLVVYLFCIQAERIFIHFHLI